MPSEIGGSMIELVNIKKTYIDGDIRVEALKGISLTINPGEIICITGPSGGGKTTLLNITGGLDRPTSGKVIIRGENLADFSSSQLNEFRKSIGYIFQYDFFISTLNLIENLLVPASILQLNSEEREQIVTKAETLLDFMDLSHRADHLPFQLSGGELRRATIIRALLYEPDVLLADEPTSNIDKENKEIVMEMLRKERGKRTIVIATHDIELLNIADRGFKMNFGELIPLDFQ
jgi:ABC-type lipoprotein export system ATPase subunit